MKRLLLLAIALIGLTGCGPSNRDVVESQLNQMADTWDGGDKFEPQGVDPWGEPYWVKVEKGDVYNHLAVRSNGSDRLPQSRDDVVVKRSIKHTPISKAVAPAVERLGEALGKGLGRGGVAGVKEGVTGKKAEEKKE